MSGLGIAACPCGGAFVVRLGSFFLGPFPTHERAREAARSLQAGIADFGPMLGIDSAEQVVAMIAGEGGPAVSCACVK